MSSPLMLTPPWYDATASACPSTGYNNIVHQTAGHMSNSGTTRKRGNAANTHMALLKNTINKLGPKLNGSSAQTTERLQRIFIQYTQQ